MNKEDKQKVIRILATYNLPRDPDINSSGALLNCERETCASHILAELSKPGELLSDEEINKAWDDAFDKPIEFDHKPTAEEIFMIRMKAVAQAQLDQRGEG